VRFHSVPAFVFALDLEVDVPGYGTGLKVDVSYGGAFYAFIPATELGRYRNIEWAWVGVNGLGRGKLTI
jgi:proline racemase